LAPLLSGGAAAAPRSSIRHVAIAGVSYCGSTLFDRLLGGLPGVRSIGESHWLIKTYENRVAAPIDFADPTRIRMLSCTVCGPRCKVLTLDFRTRLGADRSNWYFRIAQQLGTELIVSADKNPSKLIENDPLLRMDLLVLFKSPVQAWASQLDKLPKNMAPDFYLQELEKYIPQWCRAYEAFLHQFRPTGKSVFLSFDDFVRQPRKVLQSVCAALDLPFDPGVLAHTVPGHAIGGNGRAMARLRDNDYAVNILPLDEPKLAIEQEAILAADTRMKAVHEQLMARFNAMRAQFAAPEHEASPPRAGRTNGSDRADFEPGSRGKPRLRRFELPTVHPIHYDGIFGDFADNVQAHITKLEQKGTPSSKIKASFFKHLLNSVDADQYEVIQRTYLKPASPDAAILKYLDPIQWFDVKLNAALKLELHKRNELSILDLATGPGYFATIAQFFGHRVLGTDELPEPASQPPHLFDALSAFYGVRKIPVHVEPFKPLSGDFEARFDLAVSLMPSFSLYRNGRPWAVDAWQFLLDDICARILKPHGGIFVQFNAASFSDETWRRLAGLATWSNEPGRHLYIADATALAPA
jgi:hypothetical protein